MRGYREGDYVEVAGLPGLIWQVFEVTQIKTVTLNLWYEPPGWEPPSGNRFLFEVLKSGDLVDQSELQEPNAMEVLAVTRAREG